MIEFVQQRYSSAGIGGFACEQYRGELRATQRHAFDAVWRRSRNYGRQALLEITQDAPLATCQTCLVVFADNPRDRGPMALKCPRHRGY